MRHGTGNWSPRDPLFRSGGLGASKHMVLWSIYSSPNFIPISDRSISNWSSFSSAGLAYDLSMDRPQKMGIMRQLPPMRWFTTWLAKIIHSHCWQMVWYVQGSRKILHSLPLPLPATRESILILNVYTRNKSFTTHAILPWHIGRYPHWQSTRFATRWFVKTYSDSPKYSAILYLFLVYLE